VTSSELSLEHIRLNHSLYREMQHSAFKSKKFLAFFIYEILSAGMAIFTAWKQPDLNWPLAGYMTGIAFSMGAAAMWYLGKQAATDMYIRGFAMVAGKPGVTREEVEEQIKSSIPPPFVTTYTSPKL
jgi:hypothetical protein